MRSLVHLSANASTARTLNLISVWERSAEEPDYARLPFFDSPVLNRSIVLKHRLRHYERDIFQYTRSLATKVILPIDPTDLNIGARSFFVGQKGYEAFLDELASGGDGASAGHDDKLLQVLDRAAVARSVPDARADAQGGLRAGPLLFRPDRLHDMTRMFNFVRGEVAAADRHVVRRRAGDEREDWQAGLEDPRQRQRLRTGAAAASASTLDMSKPDFEEGVFCWKGFIYYKWTLTDLLPRGRPVAAADLDHEAGWPYDR